MKRMSLRHPHTIPHGFTLVELVVVITLLGALSAGLAVFMRPALQGFAAQRNRSELLSAAQAALHTLRSDIQSAVPNSLRGPGGACFELVPTVAGGAFRRAPDTTDPASAWMDDSSTATRFDVLGPVNGSFALGDYVVVNNQSGNEVYEGSNRSPVTARSVIAAHLGSARLYVDGLDLAGGYTGGRFQIVPNARQAVFYVCSNLGVDAQGNGTGQLVRNQGYGFNAAYPQSCPAATGAVLATQVSSCTFTYSPSGLMSFGLMQMQLQLTRNHETISLQGQAMISNVP